MSNSSKTIERRKHPGRSGKRSRFKDKGRQVDPFSLKEVRQLLGNRSRNKDMLIEHLHLIQDNYGHISHVHLSALAHEMALSMAEVYEVATFYAHFDVVREGGKAPPPITIRVCDSLTCEMLGAKKLINELKKNSGNDIRILPAPCMGRCEFAPIAEVGHRHVENATPTKIDSILKSGNHSPELPDYKDFESYVEEGGYELLKECLLGQKTREDIITILEDSGLRGLGGAGFPTGRKWKFVGSEIGPRLMAVNADEGEPGTIKDRIYMETDPHRILEGMLIGAWAVEAEAVYFYLRDEYPHIREVLLKEIPKIEKAGFSELPDIFLRRGAGAYICGEESAMLESIEGKRGEPRHKPPFPAQVGLFGRPTLINNVETLFWIRDIVEKGPDWFSKHGRNGRQGLRSFSVSGRVREPGMKLAPAGITVKELIEEFCGGMLDGHNFKAYLPGGASGGILPATMNHIPLDFGTLEEYGCFIGSAAVIILSDQDNIKEAALNLTRFFEDESCGQCTPCRIGTEKACDIMVKTDWDKNLLSDLCDAMADASICGLGQAAPNPVRSVIRYFPEELS
tara:strand:- start:12705 stop:14408 length:1704 start_codon:yes stop_codon:yes gene_type:complete